MAEIERRNADQAAYAQIAAEDIDFGQSPLLEPAPPQMPQGAPPMAQ
jgi:hypothetical protein